MARSGLSAVVQNISFAVRGNIVCFILASIVASLTTPRTAPLSTCAVSSALLWLFCVWTGGPRRHEDQTYKRTIVWSAGALLALGQLCSRVSGDLHGWSQALIPWIVLAISNLNAEAAELGVSGRSTSRFGKPGIQTACLVLASASSLYILGINHATPTDIALGLCQALTAGIAWVLLEGVLGKEKHPGLGIEKLTLVGPHGELLARSRLTSVDHVAQSTKDLSAALALFSGILALGVEDTWSASDLVVGVNQWTIAMYLAGSARLLYAVRISSLKGSLDVSMWTLAAGSLSFLTSHPTWMVLCYTAVCLLHVSCGLKEQRASPKSNHQARRWQWLAVMVTLAFVACQTVISLMKCGDGLTTQSWPTLPGLKNVGAAKQAPNSIHPIKQLVSFAERDFDDFLARQSKSLPQVVAEYKQRYKLPPPPLFDKWYKFARQNDVLVLDDYDTIHSAMQPFWALQPSIIRSRVQEAIGYQENALIVLMIRNGRISRLSGGLPWQREAIIGLIASYLSVLPDLDIAFNAHDEPRVIVPHDELSRMIDIARQGPMADALLNQSIRNHYSQRPSDMSDGADLVEYRTSRFNEYAHQNTWVPSRLSCSPDSPARAINEDGVDDTAAFALGSLGFVSNQTASTDICNIPSLHGQHAFFDRPNAFSVAHDLVPVFSESKVSTFQDIPYPSLWHWYGALFVNSTQDMHTHHTPMYDSVDDPPWSKKRNDLYWRGSTTGGYSRDGGWRRHHRQRLVQLLNAHDQATILVNKGNDSTRTWQSMTTLRASHAHLFDVALSGVGQCDPADCHAQEEFFSIAPHAPLNATWQHKHVLDIDGNAFSARFYALLRSRSLVYKAAIFREWHDEWLVPWLHYIPLSMGGGEALEALRFFAEGEGAAVAEKLADVSRRWAGRALRRVDMEAWMYRCLLEYARVVDDNRSGIGCIG